MFAAIVLLVLVLGTVVFHFLSPWYFTPIASNWSSMDDTITLTFVVTGLAFVSCNVFIAYCIIKFRNKEGRRAEYEPESVKLETWLTGRKDPREKRRIFSTKFDEASFRRVRPKRG